MWDIIEKEFLIAIFIDDNFSTGPHIFCAHIVYAWYRQKREGREGRGGWSVNEERKKEERKKRGMANSHAKKKEEQ